MCCKLLGALIMANLPGFVYEQSEADLAERPLGDLVATIEEGIVVTIPL